MPGLDADTPVPRATTADAIAEANGGAEPDLADLTARLVSDARDLVRLEIALASAELRAAAGAVVRGGGTVFAGAAVALLGLVVLVLAAVLGVGALLGGRYWLSALVVGLLLALGGGIAILRGSRTVRSASGAPGRTMASFAETAEWARHEARRPRINVEE